MRVNVSSHDLKVSDHKHHLHPFTEHGALGIDVSGGSSPVPTVYGFGIRTETASWTAWLDCGASMSATAGRRSSKPSARR